MFHFLLHLFFFGNHIVNRPLQAVSMSADNVRGYEIFRKINIWPRSKAPRANDKFAPISIHIMQKFERR